MPIQQMLLGGGSAPPEPPGQVLFIATGSHTWTVPSGVTSVSVVCIGAGGAGTYDGGAGGGLCYGNNITVTPGASISLQVGLKEDTGTPRNSWFINNTTLFAGGGYQKTAGTSSGSERDGGGNGGVGGSHSSWGSWRWGAGGGGAGGYNGDGGAGKGGSDGEAAPLNSDGSGGGGAANAIGGCNGGGGGGGSSVLGTQGTMGDGTARTTGGLGGNQAAVGGNGGDGQGNGNCNAGGGYCQNYNINGKVYGGGRGGVSNGRSCSDPYPEAASGAVRIIWPGDTRTFPSACADV